MINNIIKNVIKRKEDQMPCRVGITTNLKKRKSYWESKVVGLKNWRVLGTYNSRKNAQDHEDSYAQSFGCEAHHGGKDKPGPWHVYRFDYTRRR